MVLIRLRDMPTLDMTLQVLFREAAEQHCGRQAVLDRLIEVVFIQVLRDLMDEQRLQVGLLAGLAEPRLASHQCHARRTVSRLVARCTRRDRGHVARTLCHQVSGSGRDDARQLPQRVAARCRQSLLRQGKPVQLLSDVVGYGSASALSRRFRAQVGVSPTAWVRQYNAGH